MKPIKILVGKPLEPLCLKHVISNKSSKISKFRSTKTMQNVKSVNREGIWSRLGDKTHISGQHFSPENKHLTTF
jgi:hypothetical protein